MRSILEALNARVSSPLRPEDLQDVVQDVVLAVWRKLPRYDGSSPLESWIFGFCRVELRLALRRRARRSELVPLSESADPAVPRDATPHDLEQVMLLLERLHERNARVIRLKHLEQLSFDEVATRLAIPTNTAKTWYYRGLAELQALLARGSDAPELTDVPGTERRA